MTTTEPPRPRLEALPRGGPEEIRTPYDDCTILMPARTPTPGKEAVYLTQPLP